MKFTIKQIAIVVGGEVQGDESLEIHDVIEIDKQASGSGFISFLANEKYENFIYTTAADAVIVNKSFSPKKEIKATLIKVDDPYSAFTTILEQYDKMMKLNTQGIESPSFIGTESVKNCENIYIGAFAYIGKNCKIGKNVKIYPHTYVGNNVEIGDETILYAGSKVHDHSVIGKSCIIHAGAIVGSDGFGFAPQQDGTYKSIPQLGNVIIEDNVSIGANTTIDRATLKSGNTIIRRGAKLDNLIQIGHNVEIGENTVVAAQTGISGSSKIGKNCAIGGQVGLAGHIIIPDNTQIGAQSGINSNIKKKGTRIQGYPAFDYNGFMKSSVVFRKLPDLQKRVDQLEKSDSSDSVNEEIDTLKKTVKQLEEKILNLLSS